MLLGACTPTGAATAAPVEAAPAAAPTAAPGEATPVEAAPVEAAPTEAAPIEAMPATDNMLPAVDPGELEGNMYTAGSSTVGPLSEAIQEMFIADGFQGEIKNDIIGSGGGFERFCKTGETDIANASRAIKVSEVESCGQLSPARTPIEFRVGTDAIAIVVSKDNDFLTNVTKAELDMIFSDKAEKWSDVNPAWPAEAIKRFIPGTDSGTFEFFVETITQKVNEIKKLDDAKVIILNAKNQQLSEDDNVLVQGVEGDKYAIGFFGFAYYQQQKDNLKAISIDGVEPNFETAESGEYALSRPLFIYSDAAILKAKPQVAGFINYYLTNVNEVIETVGYFPASEAALSGAKQALMDALK